MQRGTGSLLGGRFLGGGLGEGEQNKQECGQVRTKGERGNLRVETQLHLSKLPLKKHWPRRLAKRVLGTSLFMETAHH